MEKKTNIYLFEPYDWAYCSGTIVVIAKTFKHAIILANKKYIRSSKEKGTFSKNKKDLEKDSCNQWLLTDSLEVLDDKKPRVVISNWNYR